MSDTEAVTIEQAQDERDFQDSKEKDFAALTDREKYIRTQHHIDATKLQVAEAATPAEKKELEDKIGKLETARDQWHK